MGVPLIQSIALPAMLLFSLIIIPQLALGGITRHYHFDARHSTASIRHGTLFWHAHISWLRSTLCDPIIILPKHGVPYPFTKPYKEVSIIFGEWWNADPEAVITQALQIGGGPNVSDAYTINGLPGPLYNCSA
ncbi:hypothetical protein JHK87_023449 [Glycine soja]|nr:hypothetical protein JHK87_023449 [Glycine soja]